MTIREISGSSKNTNNMAHVSRLFFVFYDYGFKETLDFCCLILLDMFFVQK